MNELSDATMPNLPDSGLTSLRLDELAAWFKAAADPLRLLILRVLAQDSYGVLELSRLLAVKQSGMSHHLKLLASAGLLSTRREGNSVYYQRAWSQSAVGAPLQQQLWRSVDALEVPEDVKARIDQIRSERTAQAHAFFEQNSGRFRQHQDLIAGFEVYGDPVAALLDDLPASHKQRALEVGPGEGALLPVLSQHFASVWAVDISPALLATAERHCREQGCHNLHWHCGDAATLPPDISEMDWIVVNMVMHHVPSPAALFNGLVSALKPGGVLVITDLCEHQNDWAKDACGDLWLGFAPEAFSQWAHLSGMKEGPESYFALRNGFQVQIRQFIRSS